MYRELKIEYLFFIIIFVMSDLKHIADLLNQLIGVQSLTKIILEYNMSQPEDKNYVKLGDGSYINVLTPRTISFSVANQIIRLRLTYSNDFHHSIVHFDTIRKIVEKINNEELTKDFQLLFKDKL
jgi:hypothetical protein